MKFVRKCSSCGHKIAFEISGIRRVDTVDIHATCGSCGHLESIKG